MLDSTEQGGLHAALFPSKVEAERALESLLELGIAREHLSLITRSERALNATESHHVDDAVGGAVKGAAVGAAIGGVLGALILGPIGLIGLGPIAAAAFGIGGGTVYGAIGGVLSGSMVPDETVKYIAEEIDRGRALVTSATGNEVSDEVIAASLKESGGELCMS